MKTRKKNLVPPVIISVVSTQSYPITSDSLGMILLAESGDEPMAPDPGWFPKMKTKFSRAGSYFSELFESHGYKSFEDVCLQIKTSFAMLERFFTIIGIEFEESVKTNVYDLEFALVQAFRKLEAEPALIGW